MKKKVMATAALLAVCVASSLLCHNAAYAQAGMTTATPSPGVTSSFGMAPGESVGPNGLPLNASSGVSTVPDGLTGTITVPNASSGAACSTVATSPEGTFGSPTTYDGGGMAGGTTAPATAATPSSPPTSSGMSSSAISTTSGVSTTSGMLATSGLTGMCGSGASSIAASSTPTTTTSSSTATSSGAQTGIPLGSYEIGNLGVAVAPAVPIPNVLPFAGSAGSSLAPTMPAVAPPSGSSTTPNTIP
jgi:hypothetical protein